MRKIFALVSIMAVAFALTACCCADTGMNKTQPNQFEKMPPLENDQ